MATLKISGTRIFSLCLVGALLIGALAGPSLAHAYEIAIDHESVGYGQAIEVNFVGSGSLANCVELSELIDDGENNLQVIYEQPNNCPPVAGIPTPYPFTLDLRAVFDLQPGVYDLTVQVKESAEEFQFEVTDDTFAIVPGMTGSWYDPNQSGHGFNIEVLANQRIIVYWYVYDVAGNSMWLVGEGTYRGKSAELELLRASENFFPPAFDPDSVDLERWGSLSLEFSDCRVGSASWHPDDPSFDPGEMPITKLSPPNELGCIDDVISRNTYTSDNLFADDDDLEFEVVASIDSTGQIPTDWVVEMATLPENLGEGRALRVVQGSAANGVFVAAALAGVGRFEQINVDLSGPFAYTTELTLAIPAELACDAERSARFALALSPSTPTNTNSFQGVPAVGWVASFHQYVDSGYLDFQDPKVDCENGSKPIVRTFRSSSRLLIPEFPQYATLNLITSGLESTEGIFVLDFRVNLRGTSYSANAN